MNLWSMKLLEVWSYSIKPKVKKMSWAGFTILQQMSRHRPVCLREWSPVSWIFSLPMWHAHLLYLKTFELELLKANLIYWTKLPTMQPRTLMTLSLHLCKFTSDPNLISTYNIQEQHQSSSETQGLLVGAGKSPNWNKRKSFLLFLTLLYPHFFLPIWTYPCPN